MRWGWTEQIVRMPLKAVPGAAVAKALLSAREVIILPQPKPTSFKWPGGTASGRRTAWGVDSEVQRLRRATLCCLVMTKNSTFIKKPQNRPIWQGKISRPSQEMLCFPSITRFICICSVFQTLGWCFMSSSFSAPVLEHPLADPSEQALISRAGMVPPCPTTPAPPGNKGILCQGVFSGVGGSVPASLPQPLPSLCWAGIANL